MKLGKSKEKVSADKAIAFCLPLLLLGLTTPASAHIPPNTLKALGAQDLRLASVGYRLARANAGTCTAHDMLTGMVLHDLSQYDAGIRPDVAETFSLDRGVGVLGVVPASPADRAGLQRNDEILAINDTDVQATTAKTDVRKASFERMARISSLLDQALRAGPVHLIVERAGAILSIDFAAEAGCGGQFNLTPSRSLNAWSDGTYVVLSTAIMNFARNDDELAFVVAHEMSHNILRHATKLEHVPSGLFGLFGKAASVTRATEIEADAYAVRLMEGAGYQPLQAVPFLQRSRRKLWWAYSTTHPGFGYRIRTINATVAQLHRSQPMAAASIPHENAASIRTSNAAASTI